MKNLLTLRTFLLCTFYLSIKVFNKVPTSNSNIIHIYKEHFIKDSMIKNPNLVHVILNVCNSFSVNPRRSSIFSFSLENHSQTTNEEKTRLFTWKTQHKNSNTVTETKKRRDVLYLKTIQSSAINVPPRLTNTQRSITGEESAIWGGTSGRGGSGGMRGPSIESPQSSFWERKTKRNLWGR